MVHGFLKLDVQLLSACGLTNDVSRFTPIRIRSSARAGLLRIAQVAFDKPRGRLQEFEVRQGIVRSYEQDDGEQYESRWIFHGIPPLCFSVRCLRRRSFWTQDEFLNPPVHDLGNVEFILRRAGDLVDPAELLRLFA